MKKLLLFLLFLSISLNSLAENIREKELLPVYLKYNEELTECTDDDCVISVLNKYCSQKTVELFSTFDEAKLAKQAEWFKSRAEYLTDKVDDYTISETIKGESAQLIMELNETVVNPEGQTVPQHVKQVPFVKENGAWKIGK